MGASRQRRGTMGESGDGSSSRLYQPPLPFLRPMVRACEEDGFAHPAERTFAGLLTYYGIRWVYEPTTFTLASALDGRPAEMFTPDFYLPDARLYIELTTMRQRLVTRKNRKVRLLRARHPNVRIKLVYRRDYHRLLEAYRPAPPLSCQPGRILYTADAIATRVGELAREIAGDFGPAGRAAPGGDRVETPLLVLGVGRGAELFMRALLPQLTAAGLPAHETDRIELSRYRALVGGRRVRVRRAPRLPLAGRRVLLVEDIVSTGLSLRYVLGWLRRRGAATVEVCALLDRRCARLVDVPVRYAGFEAPGELVVGFGFDLRRQFRDLPFIAELETRR